MAFKDLFKHYPKDEGGYEQDGYDQDYDSTYGEQTEEEEAPAEQVGYAGEPSPMNISGNSIELKVMRPKSFMDADQIAGHLLDRRTVVLNLEDASREEAKRLIDFLTGVVFAIKGDIRKVSTNTYVITPGNVVVSGDSRAENAAPAEEPVADDTRF